MDFKKIAFTFGWLAFLSANLHAQVLTDHTIAIINSEFDELSPHLSSNGKFLFVTRSNHPANVGGVKDPGDIWYTKYDGIAWGILTHAGTQINDKGYNAVVGSKSTGEIYIANHIGTSADLAKTQGIACSRFENGTWSKPENIIVPYFHSKTRSVNGFLTSNGKHFVYAADTYGSQGVEDIYVISYLNDAWTEPKNVGSTINTNFQELSPSMNSLLDTLFFSSNGRSGAGSFDVFAAVRLDDTWTNWSQPVAIEKVNTSGRELFYTSLGNGVSLYTSTLNSDGYGDVRIYPSGREVSVDSLSVDAKEIPKISENRLSLKGRVVDGKTKQTIQASLQISNANDRQRISSFENGFTVLLSKNEIYEVNIEAKGYVNLFQKISFSSESSDLLDLEFSLFPIEKGTTVNLKNVLFKQSSTELLGESASELESVVSFLRSNPSVKILVMGHTDNRGVQKENLKLSKARAEAIKVYLESKGISSKRIKYSGMGGLQPIATNESEESRKLNRRVEFTIIKN